jgi:hypothetical protein
MAEFEQIQKHKVILDFIIGKSFFLDCHSPMLQK